MQPSFNVTHGDLGQKNLSASSFLSAIRDYLFFFLLSFILFFFFEALAKVVQPFLSYGSRKKNTLFPHVTFKNVSLV